MKRATRFATFAMTGLIGLGTIAPMAANASPNGRTDAALALGAISAGLLLTQRDKTPGIVVGAGALVLGLTGDHHNRGCDVRYVPDHRSDWDHGRTAFRPYR